MSIINRNGKGHVLISFLFPEQSTFPEQIAIINNIKNLISSTVSAKYPKMRYIIGDDELINQNIQDNMDQLLDKYADTCILRPKLKIGQKVYSKTSDGKVIPWVIEKISYDTNHEFSYMAESFHGFDKETIFEDELEVKFFTSKEYL